MRTAPLVIDLGGSDAMHKKLGEVVTSAVSQLVAEQSKARNVAFDALLRSATNERARARIVNCQAAVDLERTAMVTLAVDLTAAFARENRDRMPSSWAEGLQRAFRRLRFDAIVR